MNVHRLLTVGEQGPLQASRQLLLHLWRHADLKALLIPTWTDKKHVPEPRLLEDASDLESADPFAPFMPHNAAGEATAALERLQGRRLALAMRPCELRSFKALARRRDLDPDQAMLVSTDCLSAFEVDDIEWRSAASKDPQRLTLEALRFAAQGGILASRYRGSCQFCDQLVPDNIDVHIGVLGVETSKHILVSIRDPRLDESLTNELGLSPQLPGDVAQRRERVLKNLAAWRKRTWEQALANLDMKQATLEALCEHLVSCASCRLRLQDHCPAFDPGWLTHASAERHAEALAWIASCGGCGTCEHKCPDNYPLFMTIWFLKQQAVAEAA